MSHTAQALVLHCIDFRFINGLNHWLDEQGLTGQYDRVAIAGAAKNLVDPTESTDPELVLRQVAIAQKLHSITEVWLVNHLDCGAYGKIFADAEEEHDRHVRDLEQSQRLIEQRFPGLQVKRYIARLSDETKVEVESLS